MNAIKDRTRLAISLASALFFLSGGTGLAYQVAWSKRFSHVWGSSTLAMAAVVASFLFGLGLGAHVLGRVADRTRSCLFGYGLAEAAIGVLAILIPFEIQLLGFVSSALYPLLEQFPILHSLARFLLTFVVIGPACFLMGGTLPLLIRQFTPPDGGPSASAGWLYAINTLGAATGAYVAGFHLLPTWGLFKTNLAVAALNVAIGMAAMIVAYLQSTPSGADAKTSPSPLKAPQRVGQASPHPQVALGALYATVALTGAASLILEMVWTRQLAVMLGGSTYAFSSMLALLLVGIGVGSLAYHLLFRDSQRSTYVPAITMGLIGLTTWGGKTLIPQLSLFVGTVRELRSQQGWNASISICASAVLELLPAIGMGLLFPIFIERTRKSATDAGKAIGAIYAWNTVGSILGATATFLILVPSFGLAKTAGIALFLYGIAMLLCFPFQLRPSSLLTLAVLCLLMTVSWHKTRQDLDPMDTDLGLYLYGRVPDARARYTTAYFKEGASSNVYVTATDKLGNYSLRVNGKVDASSTHDMNMQLGLAYFPMFLAPASRDACIIGFGSGTTSGAMLLFPQSRVTCCEIEPAVVAASPFFQGVNHSPELLAGSERFQVVYDDGRSHLQGTHASYDLILSEPSNPWIAGVSNLFTFEFYEAAKKRLKPGGILAQWLQVYNFSPDDYAMILRTVLAVFPECALVRISTGDTILLTSTNPITGTKASLDSAQALVSSLPAVQGDLARYFHTTDVRSLLLAHLLLDTESLRKLAASRPDQVLNSDLNMKLEFDAPLRLFSSSNGASDSMAQILLKAELRPYARAAAEWGLTKEQAVVFHDLPKLFEKITQADLVRGLTELGLQLDPERPDLLADKLAQSAPQDPAEFRREVEKVLKLSSKDANRLGVLLFKSLKFDLASEVFRLVLVSHPQSTSTWNNLAISYEAMGRAEDAEQAFQKSLAIDPLHKDTAKSYETFQEKRRHVKGIPGQKPEEPEEPGSQDPPPEDSTRP